MNRTFLLALFIVTLFSSPGAIAQEKKRVERAADLPRFNYPIAGKVEDLVKDDAAFAKLASAIRRDVASVLATYDIADKSIERQLLFVLMQLDYLEGRLDDAAAEAAQIRALQEKPASKLMSGIQVRAMIAARKSTGNDAADAYRTAVAANVSAELKSMPYELIANDVRSLKAAYETLGETVLLGGVREVLQPTVEKTGALSSDLAPRLVNARYGLRVNLPLKRTMIDTYAGYLAANKIEKPEIWSARSIDLSPGRNYTPVTIAVWDGGSDVEVFKNQVLRSADGKPAVIAYDLASNPSSGDLFPLSPALKARLPAMRARTKGLSDLRSNIDSPEASELKQYLSDLKPVEYKVAIEELRLANTYNHGTHVAGIALAGNPYARLVVVRIEYDYKLLPDPCPSKELAERDVRQSQAIVDFLKRHGVRAVNMSWSGSIRDMESVLELCGIGKTPDERKAIAREYFDIAKNGLANAFRSAPDILFIAAAGNADQDSTFSDAIPAGLSLPNLITVGAVDKAGDEASFTSYGPTVVVHANGYQVESFLPGGDRVALSGTSMSAPQVANLAGKMLAMNPKLTPVETIAIIKGTAEKTADGRRTLIYPAKAVAEAAKINGV